MMIAWVKYARDGVALKQRVAMCFGRPPLMFAAAVALRLLLFLFFLTTNALAVTDYRWQPDPELNSRRHGAQDVWHGNLWGFDFLYGDIWAFDGTTYRDGGRLPDNQHPYTTLFTDDGIYAYASHRTDAGVFAEVLFSPDGFQDFQVQLSVESSTLGQPFAAGQDDSLINLGDGKLMFFEYSDEAALYYTEDAGNSWQLLFRPELGSIRHYHGAFYDKEYQKLYVMSGDSNSQASIMVADDIFGENGLVNNPALWRTRWGMDDKQRTTLDPNYFLAPDGVIRSQRTRTVDMEVDGDYIYWGEDYGAPEGQSVYRVNRQTQVVEEVGAGDVIGAPWRFLHTADGKFLMITACIFWNGSLMPSNDEFVRIYEFNEDRTDYRELARFRTRENPTTGADVYGFVEAFDRLWINGYKVSNTNLDLVGKLTEVELGDYDDDGQLTVADVDTLTAAIREGQKLPIYDLELNGYVNLEDLRVWVEDLKGTSFGDGNLDGVFDSLDLIDVLSQGDLRRRCSWQLLVGPRRLGWRRRFYEPRLDQGAPKRTV